MRAVLRRRETGAWRRCAYQHRRILLATAASERLTLYAARDALAYVIDHVSLNRDQPIQPSWPSAVEVRRCCRGLQHAYSVEAEGPVKTRHGALGRDDAQEATVIISRNRRRLPLAGPTLTLGRPSRSEERHARKVRRADAVDAHERICPPSSGAESVDGRIEDRGRNAGRPLEKQRE